MFTMSNAKPMFTDSISITREPARKPTRSPGPASRPESPRKELIPIIGTSMKPSRQPGRISPALEVGAAATRGVGGVAGTGAVGAVSPSAAAGSAVALAETNPRANTSALIP
jgi:hypothetical protein